MDKAPLVEALRDGSLLAFLGAGISRTFKDALTGQEFPGLPTAQELVATLHRTRPTVVGTNLTFPQACFLLKKAEGRHALEKFLQNEIEKPTLKPLPAHTLCAVLTFAGYITTNYDTLLEKALSDARRAYHVLVKDEDVTRLRSEKVPLIKLHGCITAPGSLIAADDEYVPLESRAPILEAFMKSHLANKTVVFLGFSLQDMDFKLLYEEVHKMLGKWKPQSYAVVVNPATYDTNYWETKGVKIIDQDLTAFLSEIIKISTNTAGSSVLQRRAIHHSDEWLNNPFFTSLRNIRSLPSETQVIDAFLTHLLNELQIHSLSLDQVISKARSAKDQVLQHRLNYVALRQLGQTLLDDIETTCNGDKDAAERKIKEVVRDREAVAAVIRDKAANMQIIKRGDNILVYSQSVRVLDILRGAPRGVQDTCKIFLAECRPKSPESFQDALAIAENLKGSGYDLTLIPDASIANLFERNQIKTVILGAHAVHLDGIVPKYFVNTCGTLMVLHAAHRKNIPVFVVAESFKHVPVIDPNMPPTVSYEEEEALYGDLDGKLAELKAARVKISAVNIGYDLCPVMSNVQILSEK